MSYRGGGMSYTSCGFCKIREQQRNARFGKGEITLEVRGGSIDITVPSGIVGYSSTRSVPINYPTSCTCKDELGILLNKRDIKCLTFFLRRKSKWNAQFAKGV